MDIATTSPMDRLHSFNSCTEHTGNGSHTHNASMHIHTHAHMHIHTHNNLPLKFLQFLVHALKDLSLMAEVVNMLLQGGILCQTTVEAFEGLQDPCMRHMMTQHHWRDTHIVQPVLQHPDPLPHVDVLLLAAVRMEET